MKHTGEAERFNAPAISSYMSALPGVRWGDVRRGRIPAFVRNDEGCDTSALPRSTATERAQSRAALDADAEEYMASYNHALQYFQMRCQHHMHPERRVKRKVASGREFTSRPVEDDTEIIRIIPNACQAKGRAKECKHGAPWTSRPNKGEGCARARC